MSAPIDNPPGGATFVKHGGDTGLRMRTTDWSRSRLGPVSTWPHSLRTAISICIGSRFPIALYWGDEFVMLYNDALIPMIGDNKHPQALGRPAFEVLPEVREQLEPLFRQVVTTGEAIWSEDQMLPLVRHDVQQEGYFTFTYSPIYVESGAVGGVFCAAMETTDKVIEGRRLRVLNALANAAQATSREAACAQAAAQLGTDPEDIPFAAIYLVDDSGGRAELAGTANIAAGDLHAPRTITRGAHPLWPADAIADAPREVALADGPNHARGAVILPIERAGGAPFGFVVAGVSALLRPTPSYGRFHNLLAASISQAVSNAAAYQEQRERAESLAALDRAKTAFFSNVSHEFRTPLTLMLAPIQDLRTLPPGAAPDPASVELLHRNSLRLLKLVNTLLEFSRIEAGRVDASYEPTDLSALTADLASSFRAAIERAGLRLIVECPPFGELAYVDRDMWEKVVLNLLSNAFKFTFEGTIVVRVSLTDASWHLEVIDTGTGMSEAELPRLFERFHRIEGARSRSHEGSGIGLALIQELVRLHGGAVHVDSALGKGTRFEVELPRGTAHLPVDRIAAPRARPATALGSDPFVSEALRWVSPTGVTKLVADDRRPRIIVADDNADMREYVARLLGERWRVETHADGIAALAAIRARPPALVLTDVMMPGLSGFDVVRGMRADPELRAIPVILLSARAGAEDTAAGLSSGANDYIAKPFSARELLLRVASSLESTRIGEEMRARERAQRDNLYRHFMQAPFPVAVLRGPDHVVDLANPSILRAWAKTARVVGLPIRDAIPELEGQPFVEQLDGVYRTGTSFEGHAAPARLPTGPGGELVETFFNFVYAPLRDPHGAIEGVLVSAFDVSTEVSAAQELQRSAAEQLRVAEFQERFVAVLGHDLRNPLAAIDFAAGLLTHHAEQHGDALALKVLARVSSSSSRMSRMVEQVLDLTRTRIGGGLQIVPRPIDVRAVLAKIIDELAAARPTQRIELRSPDLTGVWDPDRLEQVFSNLIGNALHHGAPERPVTVTGTALPDAIVVEVHNFGPPIPDAIRTELFSPFRRGARDSRHSQTAGLGLGLYISRELVAGHGGALDVTSTESAGTTFRVSLPRTGASS